MEPVLSEISNQQKNTWNEFSGNWKKWDAITMTFLHPMGEEMIEFLNPTGKQLILDIAGGTGEPGLHIASLLSGGKVVITDIAENMLEVAKEKVRQTGIQNVEFITCDVSELPFRNESFDAISCRFGFMFFPDLRLAANEMYRVLKPGGKIAAAVWNIPEKNFWVTATMGTIMKNLEMSPPPPDTSGMFRCAKPGRMKTVFENAGFSNYHEKEITSLLETATVEQYWEMMTEVGAPILAALRKADEKMKDKIKKEVFELVRQKNKTGQVKLEASALVLTANK